MVVSDPRCLVDEHCPLTPFLCLFFRLQAVHAGIVQFFNRPRSSQTESVVVGSSLGTHSTVCSCASALTGASFSLSGTNDCQSLSSRHCWLRDDEVAVIVVVVSSWKVATLSPIPNGIVNLFAPTEPDQAASLRVGGLQFSPPGCLLMCCASVWRVIPS
jgi:hypothetical protein